MVELSINKLTHDIIGAVYEVKRILGNHLYERAYELALKKEIEALGYNCDNQVAMPVLYKGYEIQNAYKIDLLVEGAIPLELKTLPFMGNKEVSQLLCYMSLGAFNLGYLINFHAQDMKPRIIPDKYDVLSNGIYRVVL
ncbi:MAG: GxxExxY protein [Bacteroidales bacterium]|nr:GxxExxY protein [Bacteroidales bacterium]